MEHWDSTMRADRLGERLAALSREALAVFAIGCGTHARDVIVAQATHHNKDVYMRCTSLLDEFWLHYPTSMSRLREHVARAGTLVPDEDADLIPGEGSLLWSMLYAFKCADDQTAIDLAIDAAGNAYQAVYEYFCDHGQEARSEGQIFQAELYSTHCRREIEFQKRYLNAIEAEPSLPASYLSIANRVEKPNQGNAVSGDQT